MNKEILPVLEEISAVLKKHDMTGLVIVGNRSHVDWRIEIEASWSCAWLERQPDSSLLLRVRSKRGDYPTQAAQNESLDRTVGTFVSFSDALVRLNENVEQVLVMLSKYMTIEGKSTTEDGGRI
jgi:hypothetical protein